jgi:glutamate-1-semialdehyde 2,1-aminomutase
VDPDIAMFGKALGNGYAITAIIGTRSVMEEAQSTFISSTFWTERIGPTAALATLKVMEEVEAWARITATGNVIRNGIKALADSHNLQIKQWGLAALTGYTFDSKNSLAYKTLVTQEMLKQGFLASNSVYVCTAHSPEIISNFFEQLDPIFGLIKDCEEGRDIMSLLKGPVCDSGFKRFN